MDRSPIQWALLPLKKYATFSGRAPRAEFWWFMLALVIFYFAFWLLFVAIAGGSMAADADPGMGVMGMFGGLGLVFGLVWLALLIPIIAVQVRRMHDLDRSGWWIGIFYILYLLSIVVMFGSVGMAAAGTGEAPNMGTFGIAMILSVAYMIYAIVLLVFFVLPGTKGPNRFGPDPYGADHAEVFR